MEPISGINSSAAQMPAAASGAKEPPEIRRPEDETQGRLPKPAVDEYATEQKQEPSGRYWLSKDGNGQPTIHFDDPERAANSPQKSNDAPRAPERGEGAKGAMGKEAGKKAEACTGDTGKVDREIEKLKKMQKELRQQLNRETDEVRAKDLEKKLAQVERELRQKDNDTYRRQHTQFS